MLDLGRLIITGHGLKREKSSEKGKERLLFFPRHRSARMQMRLTGPMPFRFPISQNKRSRQDSQKGNDPVPETRPSLADMPVSNFPLFCISPPSSAQTGSHRRFARQVHKQSIRLGLFTWSTRAIQNTQSLYFSCFDGEMLLRHN